MPFNMPAISPENVDRMVWPAPPEIPRYAFVGYIYGESNGEQDSKPKSTMEKFLSLITGVDDRPENFKNLIQPQQVTTDGLGRVFVADAGQQSIFVFDESLGEFSIWDAQSLNLPLLAPVGIAYGFDSLWVSDSGLSRVFQLDAQGQLVRNIGEGVLVRPTGIAVDRAGQRVFISDTGDGNIKVFDLNGKLLDTWGQSGSGKGELNHPTFISFVAGHLYVADSLNARIQIFDDSGRHHMSFGERGLYVGNLARPKGIALDSEGHIYVSESYYDHLLIYDSAGAFLMSIGGSGDRPGNFYQPTGVWVDEHDRIFVSDMLNGRVAIFQYLGEG